MASISDVREHMEIIGADGAHVGTVDSVEGNRIKMTKRDSGSHHNHHHYIPGGLIAGVEGDKVRLSANADNALLFEEEKGGEPLGETSIFSWRNIGIGVAAVAGVAAAAGAYVMQGRRDDKPAPRTRRSAGAKAGGAKTKAKNRK